MREGNARFTHLSPLPAKGLLVVGLEEHDEEERGGDAEAEQNVAGQVQRRVEVGVCRGQLISKAAG